VLGLHWCGVTRRTSMEEQRRSVHGARRLEGTPTSMESRIRAAQKKGGKLRFSQRGRGVVVTSLTKKAALCRCSRRRPAPRSVSAFSSRCGRPLSAWRLVRHPLATVGLQQRRAGNGVTHSSLLPASTPLPPLQRRSQEWGKPQSELVGSDSDPGVFL
jgi:hypothetical protein